MSRNSLDLKNRAGRIRATRSKTLYQGWLRLPANFQKVTAYQILPLALRARVYYIANVRAVMLGCHIGVAKNELGDWNLPLRLAYA